MLNYISKDEKPYGIEKFKDSSPNWSQYYSKDKANFSFDINISMIKKLASEEFYEDWENPAAPGSIFSKFNLFENKILSIYDFFYCNSDLYEPGIFTFGNKQYIKLPPFSQSYENWSIFSNYVYPPPRTGFYINPDNAKQIIDNWKMRWNNYYNYFYQNYFSKNSHQNLNVFRYTLEALRTASNIHFPRIKNFLLVSTLEGLLFSKKIRSKLRKSDKTMEKNEKKITVSKTFVKVCEIHGNYWQRIFGSKYPLKNPLKTFQTKSDLEELLIVCFKHRNNIAHPENIKKINIAPQYLKSSRWNISDDDLVERIINDNFPIFLKFLLKIWLKKGFKTDTN